MQLPCFTGESYTGVLSPKTLILPHPFTMGQLVQLYLLGDEAYDFLPKLRTLIHSRNNPILVSFFQQAFHTIRSEIGQLPLEQRLTFPPFSSLADLLARQNQGTLSPAFQTALSCIYQLGLFIRCVQTNNIPLWMCC